MISRFLSRLAPHSEEHLILGCVAGAVQPFDLPGVAVTAVESTTDAGRLDAFASANGFPEGWAGAMLEEGAQAMIAVEGNTVLAMAWMTRRPFFVEEIAATLDPGGGVYLFGDFVAPAHRGRRLQRLLVSQRLSRSINASFACTLVHPSNRASIRSYRTAGFGEIGAFVRRKWGGRTWARARCAAGPIGCTLDGERLVITAPAATTKEP